MRSAAATDIALPRIRHRERARPGVNVVYDVGESLDDRVRAGGLIDEHRVRYVTNHRCGVIAVGRNQSLNLQRIVRDGNPYVVVRLMRLHVATAGYPVFRVNGKVSLVRIVAVAQSGEVGANISILINVVRTDSLSETTARQQQEQQGEGCLHWFMLLCNSGCDFVSTAYGEPVNLPHDSPLCAAGIA